MKYIEEIKHFWVKHTKEMIYFLMIYFFSVVQSGMIFLYLKKHNQSQLLMVLSLIISSIPASIYTEYSYRVIGFKKSIRGAVITFVLLNSFLLLIMNLDHRFLPFFYNYIFLFLIAGGFYFSKGDTCSCNRALE